MTERRLYLGPSLRRFRRERGLTQADMAADLEVSASYIALLERNHRPLTAEVLLRLAQTYQVDVSSFAGHGGADDQARLQAALRHPLFADIELPALELSDIAANFPGMTDAFLRLYGAYQEDQAALADHDAGVGGRAADPVAEARQFLAARRNSFPLLDDVAERLAKGVSNEQGLINYLKVRHGLGVRRLPPEVMVGSVRRLDHHRKEVVLDDELDHTSQMFQLALQLVYLEMGGEIGACLGAGEVVSEGGGRCVRR